jgi:hypothetical protein
MKKLKYLIIILMAPVLFSGCKKDLNVLPTTSAVDGNVIVDQQSAMTVLSGIYYQFASAGVDRNNVPCLLWSDYNEAIPSSLSGMLTNSSWGWSPDTFTPTYFGVDYQWNNGYAIINAANGFIKNVTPVSSFSASIKMEMIAEAKFLRAYGNAKLLLYYGQYYDVNSKYGIIIRNEFVSPRSVNLPRANVGACYDAIIADLDSAIQFLPAKNTQICYANVSAAKLLKARVLINRGTSGDYASVISLTNDIIQNGPFALEDSTKDIFLTKGPASNEVILTAQPFPLESYKYKNYQYNLQYQVTPGLVTLLKGDPRSNWVYKEGSYYGTPALEFTKYYSGDPINVAQTSLSENCYVFRLSEAYLLEAEAIALSNGNLATGKSLLETVLKHAGVKDFSDVETANADQLHTLVIKEEIKNFVGENGVDWFALRRLYRNNNMAPVTAIDSTLKSLDRFILPIPIAEINANPFVVQNPNY